MTDETNEIFEFKSEKSRSIYIAKGNARRAYLQATGEASTNTKVIKEVDRIRRQGATMYEVKMTAKQFSKTY